jgi:hypothetical protein
MFRTTMCLSSEGQLYEYIFWYIHSVLVAVRYAGQDEFHLELHIGRPLAQSDNTRCFINAIVLLKMSTVLLETCKGFK